MNIESFLDPMGGTGDNSTINNGMLGLIGWGMSSHFMDKYYFDPVMKGAYKTAKYHKKRYEVESTKAFRRSEVAAGLTRTKRAQAKAFFTGSGNSAFRSAGGILRNNTPYPGERIGSQMKRLVNNIGGHRGFVKAAGWAFILAGMADIGEALFTPGVNKVASQRDMQMFMDESPLDSSRASTARQRALMAIHNSQMNVNQVIGNEASYLLR